MADKPKSKLFDDSDEDDYKPSDTAASSQPVQQSETAYEQNNNEEYVPN